MAFLENNKIRNASNPIKKQAAWSKSKRERRISYISMYMWNLEKRCRWTYTQSRSRKWMQRTDVRTPWGRGGGMTQEGSPDMCTPPCVNQRAELSALGYLTDIHACTVMSDSFCDPMDSSPPVHGVSQARTLEWVAISFSSKCFYFSLKQYMEFSPSKPIS